jgi:hypothetical protein
VNKKILILIAAILVLGAVIGGWFILSSKDEEELLSSPGEKQQYNWSTIDQGPYNDQISFATSSDLLNWTDSKQVLAQHVSVPDAIYMNGMIYVYFVDVSQDGIPEQLGLLRSADKGKTWMDKVIIDIKGLGNKVAVDPDPFALPDGRIRLYYFDIADTRVPGESGKIYSAVSEDGINFVEEEGVRLEREQGLFDPDVIKVGSTWNMYVGDMSGQNTIVSVSPDGLTFKESGTAFQGGAIPNVFFDGSTFFLYTGGINIATSNDGLSFSKTKYRFESEINPLTADPGVITLGDNEYLMFYKTQIK